MNSRSKFTLLCYLTILVAFIASRVVCSHLGIHMGRDYLQLWQMLDIKLLKNHFWESLLYLHSQPPLFNFFIGSLVNLFPREHMALFSMIYKLGGLIMMLLIFYLQTALEIPLLLALFTTLLLVVSPSFILMENFLFYTYPTSVFLLLAAFCLVKATKKSPLYLHGYFLGIALTTLLRSMFHLAWAIPMIVLPFFYQEYRKPKFLMSFFVCMLLILFPYVKNAILFDQFSSSTWLGMNVYKMTLSTFSTPMKENLAAQGVIHPLSITPSFQPLEQYKPNLPEIPQTGIPALDREKTAAGEINFNHIAYITVSNIMLRDTIRVTARYPKHYCKTLLLSYAYFCLPPSDYKFLRENAKKIHPYKRLYNRYIYLQPFSRFIKDVDFNRQNTLACIKHFLLTRSHLIAIVLPLILLISLSTIKRHAQKPYFLVFLFILATVLWVCTIPNFLEKWENNRFRFVIEPFIFILIAKQIGDGFKALLLRKKQDDRQMYL